MRKFLINIITLTVPSIVFTFILLEILIRLFLSPSDIPDTRFDPVLGNQYIPNQKGFFVEGNEVKGVHYGLETAGRNCRFGGVYLV